MNRVWIPAGNTGSVDVLDVASHKVTRIDGFTTRARESRGGTRVMGPSAVAIGDGVAFIGNRATAEICSIDSRKLAKIACVELTSPADGVAYVPSTKEVWVTTPRDESVTLVDASDASHLKQSFRLALSSKPEGYAVDSARGLFFTNLEDKDKTVVIDVKSRKVMKTWNTGCGSDGPRGLAYDQARRFLSSHAQTKSRSSMLATTGRCWHSWILALAWTTSTTWRPSRISSWLLARPRA